MLTRARTSHTEVPHLGYIVTGGQDSIVNIWPIGPSREEPLYTLLGHSDNVCALHVGGDGTIISGSWDKCVPLPPPSFLTQAVAKDCQSMDKLSACLRPRGTCAACVGRGSDIRRRVSHWCAPFYDPPSRLRLTISSRQAPPTRR
jgi:WD40 repeat protein